MNCKLLFDKPAEKWEDYLPLGNGRLGCMVRAAPCNEILQLNEEGIWSGGPQNRLNPDAKKNLEKIRSLVNEGRVLEAQALGFEAMSGRSFNERSYQTAGEFHIDFFSEKNSGLACGWPLAHKADDNAVSSGSYKSELFLDLACTLVTYTDDEGTIFTRRTWISAVDDMLFMHVTASTPGKINYCGYLDRGIWCDNITAADGCIYLEDSHGIPFCVGAGAAARGGETGSRGSCLYGKACDEVLFFIDIQSLKWNKKWKDKPLTKKQYDKLILKNKWTPLCKANLTKIKNQIARLGLSSAAEDFFAWHLVEYKNYWDRCQVEIGAVVEPVETTSDLPTPELLAAAAPENTELVNQYLNFSRYLMISGSRIPGTLPLTLQGLWNGQIEPPWQSKYTININAQMNYWPANLTSLSDCELPFFDLLERCYEPGREAARVMYGCRGYVLHHNTDIWGDAAPQDAWLPATYWVLGAAWMATHIIEHFEYTMDKAFLERYYYLMHEAALFFVDYLVPSEEAGLAADGKPYLIINPSLSPENSYVTKNGEVGAFAPGCQMDNMILEHLFTGCLKAHQALSHAETKTRHAELVSASKKGKSYPQADFDDFKYVLSHLKKPSLNSDGSLMEWNTEVEEVEPGHRHISHLYGLFPGHTITLERTPELCEAAKKTLQKRLSNGGGHTGWSQAWIINFYAQLGLGNEALSSIIKLFQHSTLPNLLDNHPPFQIDGNFGALAGILRLLVQSEMDDDCTVTVKLLPALPTEPAWQSGHVKGLAIKGGYTLDFEWNGGKVTCKTLHKGNNAIAEEKIRFI